MGNMEEKVLAMDERGRITLNNSNSRWLKCKAYEVLQLNKMLILYHKDEI
ncbi:hypothetical protein [Sulfolobus tengchongensis]